MPLNGKRFGNIANLVSSKIEETRFYYLAYTAVFLAAFCLCMLPLALEGKTLIWSVDGIEQAYVWFFAVGDWIRSFFGSVFADSGLVLPMWNSEWGYGADSYVALSMFLFDPFYWVSAITPDEHAELVFQLSIVARLYCAGIAFSLFARRHAGNSSAALVASLAFVLSGAGMVCAHQGFLLNGFIYFPLMVLGADRALEGKSPVLLAASIAWAFMVQFYVAYVAVLFLVPYCCYRYRCLHGKIEPKPFLLCAVRIAGYCVLGMALAGVTLLPVAYSMVSMDRIALDRDVPLLYSIAQYYSLLKGFISHASMKVDAWFGFGPLSFVGLVVLAMRWRRHKAILLFAFALLLFHMLPVVGVVLNGMQYPGNRWVFATDFVFACVVMRALPELGALSGKERLVLLAVCVAYGVLVYSSPVAGDLYSFSTGFAVMLVMVIAAFMHSDRRLAQGAFCLTMAVLVAASSVLNYWGFLSPQYEGKASAQVNRGEALSAQKGGSPFSLLSDIDDDGSWRADSNGYLRNGSLVTESPQLSYYSSLYNSSVDNFHTGLGLTTSDLNFSFTGLSGRSSLEHMMGVEYFVSTNPDRSDVPYGYQEQWGEVGDGVFVSGEASSLAYVMQDGIEKDEYDALGMLEKQQALTQGVVVDDMPSSLSETELVFSVEERSAEVFHTAADGSVIDDWDGTSCTVHSAGEKLVLRFDSLEECESYLLIEGLRCSPLSTSQIAAGMRSGSDGLLSRVGSRAKSLFFEDQGAYQLLVRDADSSVVVNQYETTSTLYGGKRDWACNLGHSPDGVSEIVIEFRTPGVYSFESISVEGIPADSIGQSLERLSGWAVDEAAYGPNSFHATADTDGGILFASIPYSEGWTAVVDGEPAELLNVDVGFVGVAVPSGECHVEFTYQTPMLKEGATLSCLALVALALVRAAGLLKGKSGKHGKDRSKSMAV